MHLPRRLSALAALLVTVGTLTACTGTVSLDPAEGANDPLCAEVTVRLPDVVGGEERRWTDAQATGAWGDPLSVILTCGVPTPGPTELRCITVGTPAVDWIVDESDAPRYLFTTYGRTPAVEVFIDNEVVSPNDALADLSSAVSTLPRHAQCTAADEAPTDAP